MDATSISARYKKELKNSVIPFWERSGIDNEHGGYFTCLDRDGTVYDTIKYLWMQWRIVYMFAELSKRPDAPTRWIPVAEQGFNFLTHFGKSPDSNYYFALMKDGTPAIAPYSIYTEYFAALGSAALFGVTGEDRFRHEAIEASERYLGRLDDPKGRWEKKLPGWPSRKTLGHSMMLLNLWDALETHLGISEYQAKAALIVDEILEAFWNPEFTMMFENINSDGTFDVESQEGRHLNPGHALEALWFIMDFCQKHQRPERALQAARMVAPTLEFSWDKDYGGIRYFMDVLGKPHIELQADMKLWWVHCEALLALIYADTVLSDSSVETWFEKVDSWTWKRFPDEDNGEWYAYLDRAGHPSHTLKGGKWKTFFHLPRFLSVGSDVLDRRIEAGNGQ